MVRNATAGLTKVSFRRDVRLFLAVLVGFLVVVILTLLLLLQNFAEEANQSMEQERRAIGENVVRLLPSASESENLQNLETTLTYLRGRYGLQRVELERGGKLVSSGFADSTLRPQFRQQTGLGELRLTFDESERTALRRRLSLVSGISLAATAAGTLLLFFFVPRIIRPIEQLLDQAREIRPESTVGDEPAFLIETFRQTIDTLRKQESELKHLHELEKTRADELEFVTATLTRSLTSGFLSIDAEGQVVDMNHAGREILGLDGSANLGGQPVNDVLPPGSFRAMLISALRDRAALSRVEISKATEGAPVELGLTTVPLSGDSGEYLGMLALFTDLTPVRELEQRLRDTQTLADLGQMSAGIAHEFRNSLATILGFLKLARRQNTPDEMLQKIDEAEQESRLLSSAVDGLLSFAAPMQAHRQVLDLHELTSTVIRRLEPQSEGVELTLCGVPAFVDGDGALLARAIENLVRNAIDSVREKSPPDPRVEAAVSASDSATLQVRDNGIGVRAEEVPRLFLPFQSDKPHGFGLGLALARKIVLLHNGTIELNGAPGEGATVTVRLPLSAGG